MEDIYDSVLEHCGTWTDFWCDYGSSVWYSILSLDCFRDNICRCGSRFLAGTLSLRNSGESLPQIIGRYLGGRTRRVACVFTVLLMILVGAVFVSGPAELLAGMTPDSLNVYFWVIVIFLYYILATMMPIDKIIGKVYPLFAFALLFMAVGILVMLYVKSPDLPEIWNGFGTKYERNPIFPMMFISIACGAISGFHATQSPLMARCITNEKHCRPVFYGAMVTEGIVALIWAAAATYFFHEMELSTRQQVSPIRGQKLQPIFRKTGWELSVEFWPSLELWQLL